MPTSVLTGRFAARPQCTPSPRRGASCGPQLEQVSQFLECYLASTSELLEVTGLQMIDCPSEVWVAHKLLLNGDLDLKTLEPPDFDLHPWPPLKRGDAFAVYIGTNRTCWMLCDGDSWWPVYDSYGSHGMPENKGYTLTLL